MKRITKLLLMLVLVFVLVPGYSKDVYAAIKHSGNIYGVKWTIDTEGVLTVEPGKRYETNWGTVYEPGDFGGSMEYDQTFLGHADEVKKIVIKDGITKIPEYTFQGLDRATEVKIASSVEEIGTYAFYRCEKLKSLSLPKGVTTIGDYAFSSCGFKTVTIPAGIDNLGRYVFELCDLEKVTFKDGAERIGYSMFSDCTKLDEVVVPDTIKIVENYAFHNTALYNNQDESNADFIVCGPILLKSNREYFDENSSCVIPDGIVCIADDAFLGIDIRGTLEFPDSLRYIGSNAFNGNHYNSYYCDKRCKEVDLKNVEYIGANAFRYWYYLKSVDLSKVKHLGDYAFYWCNNLTSAKMAKNMEYIGYGIFSESAYDKGGVTVTQIPESADYVNYGAFWNTQIMDEMFDGVADGIYYCNKMLLYVDENADLSNGLIVADGTYVIADELNLNGMNVSSITIPESVKSIGYLYYDYNTLTDIYYAGDKAGWDKIEQVDSFAFQYTKIHYAKSNATSLKDCKVKISYTKTTYSGKDKKPTVTVTNKKGTKLKKNTDYKVIYSNNKNAGKATVTVIGQGNYCDTVEKTFTIDKVDAKDLTAKLEYARTTFDGALKTPAVIATDKNKNSLVEGTDYTVAFNKKTRKTVGRYKATVTFKGNYTGSRTFWFTIVPDAPSTIVVTLASGKTGYDDVLVKWDMSIGASGYKLYTRKGGEKSWSKAKDCGKTRKYTFKDLEDGVKYEYRVIPYYKTDGKVYSSLNSIESSVYTLKKVEKAAVSKISSSKIKMTWKDLDGETGYEVERMTAKKGAYKTQQKYDKKRNSTSIIIAPKKGTKFHHRVRAYKVETIDKKEVKVYGPWSIVKPYNLK